MHRYQSFDDRIKANSGRLPLFSNCKVKKILFKIKYAKRFICNFYTSKISLSISIFSYRSTSSPMLRQFIGIYWNLCCYTARNIRHETFPQSTAPEYNRDLAFYIYHFPFFALLPKSTLKFYQLLD